MNGGRLDGPSSSRQVDVIMMNPAFAGMQDSASTNPVLAGVQDSTNPVLAGMLASKRTVRRNKGVARSLDSAGPPALALHPHAVHRTCRPAGEIELTATHSLLNGSSQAAEGDNIINNKNNNNDDDNSNASNASANAAVGVAGAAAQRLARALGTRAPAGGLRRSGSTGSGRSAESLGLVDSVDSSVAQGMQDMAPLLGPGASGDGHSGYKGRNHGNNHGHGHGHGHNNDNDDDDVQAPYREALTEAGQSPYRMMAVAPGKTQTRPPNTNTKRPTRGGHGHAHAHTHGGHDGGGGGGGGGGGASVRAGFGGRSGTGPGQAKTRRPREVPTRCLKMLGRIGEGCFGDVYAGMLNERSSTNVPAYKVAVKMYASFFFFSSRAVQLHPNGGQCRHQFDFARPPARTPHGGASYV